jgi:hypothetical protein
VWGGDVLLERVRLSRERHEVKDPVAVVVEERDRQRQIEAAVRQQAADVVGERNVDDQQHHRAARRRPLSIKQGGLADACGRLQERRAADTRDGLGDQLVQARKPALTL